MRHTSYSIVDKIAHLDSSDHLSHDIYESVRIHLEKLLNTHRPCLEWTDDMEYIETSVLDYGLKDIFYYGSQEEIYEKFCELIEKVIGKYEPRLQDVKVEMASEDDFRDDGCLHFKIYARLASNSDESVIFESVFNPDSRNIMIRG